MKPFESITIEQVAKFPRPGLVIPMRLGFTPDSSAVTYLQSADGGLALSLWRYDIATGKRRVIAGPPPPRVFSRDEELRRERMRLREVGVTDYAFAPKAAVETLVVPMGGGVRVSVSGGELRDVPGTRDAIDPRLSPDGTKLAFVRDGDLYVIDLSTDALQRLTFDATEGLTNGLAEFCAQEELDRSRGFWWDDAGTRIAFAQADERHVPLYPIVHQGKDAVEVEYHRYPFAGEANAQVRLGVVELADGAITWMDTGDDPDFYLARAGFAPGGKLSAQTLSRDQRDLRLVTFDGREQRQLIHEHSEPWLNLDGDTRFLKSGEILWSSERTGARHLSLYSEGGDEIRLLTSGDWVVTGVIGIDEERRYVYFSSTIEGVSERHVCRVSLDGGDVERMTTAPGWHSGVLSPDGVWLIVTSQARRSAPSVALVATDGSRTVTLCANEGATAEELGLAVPEIVSFLAEDGTELFGMLYAPANLQPGQRYPVVVSVYGGPHVQRVSDDWIATVDLRAQYLSQQGFGVLKVDNRGGFNRGLAFEAALNRNLGSVEVRDQVAGVRWLTANRAWADTSRVGVYGWSYGGYMTLMCMAKAPEVFSVGVAGAPVTSWDGYDTAYTERYMGTPRNNPDGYREASVMTHVEGLAGKLLIVHGMIDENVHFRHTARLLVALASAGKEYELLVYPEERHMPRDQKGLEDQERKVFGYFAKHL